MHFITEIQGNFLIRLCIAHILADFIFQTKKMVENKKWLSKEMIMHCGIVFITTIIAVQNLKIALLITLFHYGIDGLKIQIQKTKKITETQLFIADQLAHLIIILLCWSVYFNITSKLFDSVSFPFTNLKYSTIILGYALVTTPFGYLIGLITKRMHSKKDKEKAAKNGFYIGIFERLIIFTFVLLNEYSAIGFLITGKSIIRFSSKNEDLKSEYVLLGTMISYAITIITGILIKQLL